MYGSVRGVLGNRHPYRDRIKQPFPLFISGFIFGFIAGIFVVFVIFPLALGMSLHMSLGAVRSAMPVFIGYTIYGGVMAICYHLLRKNKFS